MSPCCMDAVLCTTPTVSRTPIDLMSRKDGTSSSELDQCDQYIYTFRSGIKLREHVDIERLSEDLRAEAKQVCGGLEPPE